MAQSVRDSLHAFHDDEDGMETLQVVMIVGIAAVILLVLITQWKKIQKWFGGKTDEVIKE